MSDAHSPRDQEGEIETALLDADLFIKYRAPERALKRLHTALERRPRSIQLRERLREIASANKHLDEAARQCLALASLYIERQDFETAHERLLEAKQLDPRISIATVYRTVRLLEEKGILERRDFGGGRARFDPADRGHHYHLIDVDTGKVIEFSDERHEALAREIAARLGFELVNHRLELFGRRFPEAEPDARPMRPPDDDESDSA